MKRREIEAFEALGRELGKAFAEIAEAYVAFGRGIAAGIQGRPRTPRPASWDSRSWWAAS